MNEPTKMNTRKARILLVEDAESILLTIHDYLMEEFCVTTARTITEAKGQIDQSIKDNQPFDLLVTDIRLPDDTGFELVKLIKKVSPTTKISLITSYEINRFIDFIYEHEIDQVFTKHSNLSLHDIRVMARKTITGDIFGVEKYFDKIEIFYPSEMKDVTKPENHQLFSVTIKSTEDKVYWMNEVSNILEKERKMPLPVAKLILDELLTNAIVRAARHEDGSFKYQHRHGDSDILVPKDKIELAPEDYVILQYGYYDDWVIITCKDPHGTLRKKEVLYRLRRHIAVNPQSALPEGIADSHGRGIFLLREHLTYLIFNIQKNIKTEVLAFYHPGQDTPYKNISVYET
ncbi:MAG: response regulator [Leptospirales bacterium]